MSTRKPQETIARKGASKNPRVEIGKLSLESVFKQFGDQTRPSKAASLVTKLVCISSVPDVVSFITLRILEFTISIVHA